MSVSGSALLGTSAERFEVVTPENLPLRLQLADLGRRGVGMMIDFGLILGVSLLLLLVLVLTYVSELELGRGYLSSFFLLVTFLLRTFYFPWCELRWQGRTLGKRWVKVRVISRDGGPLTPGQVFARNLSRELELFLPLMAVFAPQVLAPGAPWWWLLPALAWVVVLTLLPFFNRHRARLGDLLAGTLVVAEPEATLLPDLAREAPVAASDDAELTFTPEQLDLYGIHELQILEDVLRRDLDPETEQLMGMICAKIQRKIDWPPELRRKIHPARFLQAFYAAQRARLEHKMLLGNRQERKVR